MNCTITVYNCSGQDLKMTASCAVSIAGNVTYPSPTTIKVSQYVDSPYTYSYPSNYPYNSFTFVGNTLFGQTNYYMLSRQVNVQQSAETQPHYVIYVGNSDGIFVDNKGNDITSDINSIRNSDPNCVTGNYTCGYVYLSKYPSWFVDGISALGTISANKNYIIALIVVILAIVVGLLVIKKMKK